MKITKFEHACLILENDTSRLVIDPGSFTHLPEDLTNISCIVVTEEHTDHYSLENIEKILKQSPTAEIITTQAVSNKLNDSDIKNNAVSVEGQFEVGGFALSLEEGDHAAIHGQSPCRVLTLKVDDFLYYPSDSYIPTAEPVQVLALPTSGPWHKVTESVNLANKVDSKQILVTHNGLYNEVGNMVTNNFTSNNIANKEREYIFLNVGKSRDFKRV